MRKLFIRQSLKDAPGHGIRWHVGRVKLMEEVWETICCRVRVSWL